MNTTTDFNRKIIHIDMDSFFVAVEMRDNPELRNQLVAVGGHPEKRGVIATCNYKARQFGVHSAMSSAKAKLLCPDLIIVPGDMAKYKQVSQQIRETFNKITSQVEPLSLDEAYLDVTGLKHCQGSATLIAEEIREQIYKTTKLTASAGVGPNKLIAKIASDVNKPNGICIVPPSRVLEFISPLQVKRLYGVGKATQDKLKKLGVNSCADLQQIELKILIDKFGKFGNSLYNYCRGIDQRRVNPERIRKSISVERTYSNDLATQDLFAQHIEELLVRLQKRMQPIMQDKEIKSIFVKLKFNDFQQTTAETQSKELSLQTINYLLEKAYTRANKPVRLLGIGVGIQNANTSKQMVFDF